MELTGLTLAQVLTTLGIVGSGVVVLYLLKLRRRLVTVPFVQLWEQVLADKQTTRLLSRLKRFLSLLLALLMVALLSLALGDPRWAGAERAGRTLVVLIDVSASMRATDAEPDRLDTARDHARSLIEGLGPADRLLIAQMAKTTTPLTPLTDEVPTLERAVDALEAEDIAVDLEAALHFANDVLRGQPGPEVVLLSDGKFEPADNAAQALRDAQVRLSWVSIGSENRNLGITAFAVRRYPLDKSQSEVLVEIWNPTDQREEVELTLIGDGSPLDVQRLAVDPGERLRRFFHNLSGADRTLEARLSLADGTPDVLPADDAAYARLPERRRARVLAVSSGNLYLSAALLLDEYLDVVETTPEAYPPDGDFDVVIFDGWVPPSPPEISAIYLNPHTDEADRGPFEVRGIVEHPFFDRIDRDHPLVQFTALRDVNVARSLDVALRDGDRVIAGSRGAPLLVTGTRNGRGIVAFTFDLRESDLPLRVAWPLLLLHAIDGFVQEEAGYVSSYRTGETWHIPVPAGTATATIRAPDGTERTAPVIDGRAVYAGTRAGFYSVATVGPGGPIESVVAANLGPSEEADISPATSLSLAGEPATDPSVGRASLRRELWPYLIMAVLFLLLVEWATFHRRLTV